MSDDERQTALEAEIARLQARAEYLEGELSKADEWKARVTELQCENALLRKLLDGKLDEYLKSYRTLREEDR